MKTVQNSPIGIFDSGVGGLTVLRSMRKYLPNEDLIYFGDTARVPYGNKSPNTVKRFSKQIMSFLLEKNVKMVVIACNTASSLALASLKKDYPIPVIGVIKPGIEEAVKATRNRRIGVIGTNSTILSRSYEKALSRTGNSCKMFSQSCPLFVPLVEDRMLRGEITTKVAIKYLEKLKRRKVDTLILGCTHYPLLKGVIKDVMRRAVLIDSAQAASKNAKNILEDKGLLSKRKRGRCRYYVSDDSESFERSANLFLKEKVKASKVNL